MVAMYTSLKKEASEWLPQDKINTISSGKTAAGKKKWTKFNTLLYIMLQTLLISFTTSVSQIKNIVTPEVDFSNNQIGTLSFSTFFTTDFDYSTSTMADLIVRIQFPFPLTASLEINWIQVTDTCIVSTNYKSATSVASTITGDSAGTHFFTMENANYYKDAKYKLIVKIAKTADIPITLGFTDPIKMSIVSSTDEHFITYATTSNIAKFYIGSDGISDFEFDLTPSYTDVNIATFTRDFYGQADVRIYSQSVARILIKLDNYSFSDDAESTCTTVADETRNIAALDSNNFYCEFESSDKKGLYFVWKDGLYAPLQTTFRMKFRIRNPDLPGSSGLKVAMMERHSPNILKFKSITSAFSCGPAIFGVNYPKMYIGPNLDTSSDLFPNVTLFTMMTSQNAVVFNSLRFTIKLSIDLPIPNDHYVLTIKIGGTANTVIPKTFIYHDFPVASGKDNIFITVDPTTRDITLNNIGSLSSTITYNFGLKVAFYGDESLVFFGSETLGSMEITDSTGTVVIKKAPPSGVKSSFQELKTNTWPVRSTHQWPTLLHTKTATETTNTYFGTSSSAGIWVNNIDTNPKYGMEKGENLQFIFKTNLQISSFSPTNRQSFIEIITHKSITTEPVAGNWESSNAETNCHLRNYWGSSLTGNIAFCYVESKNQGLFGSEYTRFRMAPSTTSFWVSTSTYYYSYIWRGTTVSKQNSIAYEDTDAAILDAYINIYEDTYTQDQTVDFAQGLKFTYLDNMIVKNWTQFQETDIEFMNYMRATSSARVLDGKYLPTFLRVGGLFDNIDTFNTNKIVIFYSDFEPLFKDINNPYEIGCSTSSTASVKCYHHEGLPYVNCDPGNTSKECKNQLMKSRIEILFSTTIISISNFYQVQVLIPIKVTENPPSKTYLALGTAKGHSSTLSAYPQMLSFQRYTMTRPTGDGGSSQNQETLLLSDSDTNTALRNYRAVVVEGTGRNGGTMSNEINMNCATRCNVASATIPDFWGVTMCAHWDFMSDKSFQLTNDGAEAFQHCAHSITYQYDNAGTTETKYCFFCPVNIAGAIPSDPILYENLKIPSNFGRNWPAGTYLGVTGLRGVYGLQSIIDQSKISTPALKFFPGFINSIETSPATIPFNANSGSQEALNLKLTFKFVTDNPLAATDWIVIQGDTAFPFAFKDSPSSFCLVGTPSEKQSCTVTIVSNKNIQLQVTTAIPSGNIEVVLYGIYTHASSTSSQISVATYIDGGGQAEAYLIDQSTLAYNLAHSQYSFTDIDSSAEREDTQILKMRNVRLSETNQAFTTDLMIDFILPSYKNFHTTDLLFINLGDVAYSTTTGTPKKQVYCEILETETGKFIPEFKSCNADDLSNIQIVASTDTNVNNFTLKISSFENPSTASVDSANQQSELRFVTDASYKAAVIEDTNKPAWTIKPLTQILTTFTVQKFISYIGLRTHIRITFATLSTAIEYESRVYLVFPYEYGPTLGSTPVSCYLNQSPLKSLYCTIINERELEITGFNPTFAAGDTVEIEIFGVEQPEIADAEIFKIGVDADNDRTIMDESSAFSYGTLATAVSNTIPLLEVIRAEYSHSYIRAKNNIIIEIRSSIDILAEWNLYIYIDYLDFEYENYGDSGNCVIQTSETSASISDNCERQGNRFKIKIKTGSTLAQDTTYTILINNVPTPDFIICNSKKPDIYVTDNSDPELLQLISTDFHQNSDQQNFKKSSDLVYLDFVGLDRSTPLTVKKGIFNEIRVKRQDSNRFNDDFTFTLNDTENGIFSKMDSTKMVKFDSMFGLENYPIYLSSSINTFTNIIPLTVTNTARFQKQLFSVFPSLRVKLSNEKVNLTVPEIVVYGTKGSVPVYIELDSLPIADVTFDITFDSTDCGDCTAVPAQITLGQTARRVKVKVTKGSDVAADVTSKIILTPQNPTTTGYGVTTVDIYLKPVASATGTSTTVAITSSDPSYYGLNADIIAPLPVSFYAITIPSGLYRKFGKQYLIDKYEASDISDNFYHISYTVSNKPNNFNFKVIEDTLKANQNYNSTIYWEDIDAANSGQIDLYFSTQDTAGGIGFVNITFVSSIEDAKKSDVVCQIAQILSFPLEK